jgi:hypothetical protein
MADGDPGATLPSSGQANGLDFLHRKLGGVPVWVYAAAIAVGAVGVFLVIRQRSSNAAQGQTQGQGLSGTSSGDASSLLPVAPVTYVTGVTSPSPQSDGSTQTPTVQVGPAAGQPNQGPWAQSVAAYANPNQQGDYTLLPFGTYNVAGPAQGGMYPVTVNGATMWLNGENVAAVNGSGGGGGLGGGAGFPSASVRYGGPNGLSTPWGQMSQRAQVPHYWGGMGGGAGGTLSQASKASGASLERLLHLNPGHKGGLARVA